MDTARRNFYARFVEAGSLVFDVGANLGNRSKVFLALGAETVAFEPQPFCADFLTNVLRHEPRFRLVRKALGATTGRAEMYISNAHTLSSLSPSWIEATKQSGRFSDYSWGQKEQVEVTTLDKAIAKYGRPSFIKIDVEGYESQVLAGLSSPVDYISIEFTFEFLEDTFRCIELIEKIAPGAQYQYSRGETMALALEEWVSALRFREILNNFSQNEAGDIYIRCR
ncbi:MAG: FkbM family methyltransferase [Desulfuromonas sp.]|nr:MAG: FkbM family methyltransferase [Desulfuromonas sp.]